MNISRGVAAYLFGIISLCVLQGSAAADEKFELKQSSVIREILFDNVGKRVSVRIDSGEELTGSVTRVGDQLVHIARLSGKDFYDAVIRIDRISAVVFKAREK